MPHGTAPAKIGKSDTAWGHGFKKSTHHRISTRVPACSSDADAATLSGRSIKTADYSRNITVHVKTVYTVVPFFQQLFSCIRNAARRAAQRDDIWPTLGGNQAVYITEFGNTT